MITVENQFTPVVIHNRDWEYLEWSQVGIFEISNPSLGVGAEISDIRHMGRPVLCLWSAKTAEEQVSAYVRGMAGTMSNVPFDCRSYTDNANALELIDQFIQTNVH